MSPDVFSRLVLVHQFIEQRHVFKPWIALAAGLIEHADEIFLAPGDKRFAGEVGVDGEGAALNFAALDGQVDIRPGDITRDNVELGADSVF